MNALKITLAAALIATTSMAFAEAPADAGKGDRAQKMHERMKAADKNGDGKISREEAAASLPRIAKHFDDIDTNKDGQITKEEMKAFHEKNHAAKGGKTS
ncbi:MAG: EF-hand domain-containing protein [Betaproteobacteria bacterium]